MGLGTLISFQAPLKKACAIQKRSINVAINHFVIVRKCLSSYKKSNISPALS
nr:unnamed protein product [Callosobruchus analis]